MNKLRSMSIVVMLTAVSFLGLLGAAPQTDALLVDTFGGGHTSLTYVFPATYGGENDTVEILLPANMRVKSATFNVSTYHVDGFGHPEEVHVDIGNDGTDDWAWNGSGYGSFGNQTEFMDNKAKHDIRFDEAGSNASSMLRIPSDAVVNEAHMNIQADPLEFFEKVELLGKTYDYLGFFSGSAGDVNNDGRPDVFGSGPHRIVRDLGHVYIWYGNDTLNEKADVDLVSSNTENYFGFWVSSAGDVNNDGFDDVIVGAPYQDHGTLNSCGAAYIYFGGDPMDSFVDVALFGNSSGDYFGQSVAGIGDVNGDGYDDVLVGAPENDSVGSWSGSAYLFFGGAVMDSVPDLEFIPADSGDELGIAVASAGDINNDTYPDFMIGADWETHGEGWGAVHVYYGGPSLDNVTDVLIQPPSAYYFGYMLAPAGDLNGDGYDDIAVQNDLNEVYVFYGGDPMDGVRDFLLAGEENDDYFGLGLDGARDINGDGYDDLVIGASGHEVGGKTYVGKGYLYYGGADMDFQPDFVWYGSKEGDELGFSAAGVGDMNNDGFNDLVFGVDGNDNGGINSGSLDLMLFYRGVRDPTLALMESGREMWNHTGAFDDDVEVENFSEDLNQGMATIFPSYIDPFGNSFKDLTINVTTDSEGTLHLKDIIIFYDMTITVKDFANLLNDFASNNEPKQDGMYHIPMRVRSTTQGGLMIDDLRIVVDEPPEFIDPGLVKHPEGSINMTRVDLWDLFDDDFNDDLNLTFRVDSYTNDTYVTVGLFDGHYLSVDSLTDSKDVNWTGYSDVMVRATDKNNLTTDPMKIRISITDVPDAPVITSAPISDAMETVEYSYGVKAVDGDLDEVLEYTLVKAPDGMVINSTSGLVRWLPELDDLGTHEIIVMASDGALNDTQEFMLRVTIRSTQGNALPVVTSTPRTQATVGVEYTYQISAYDDDFDPLVYSMVEGPPGLGIDGSTGWMVWLPTLDDVGLHGVIVNISDGKDRVFHRWTINVSALNLNHLPVIIGTPKGKGYVGIEYYSTFNYTDEDGDKGTFSLVSGPTGMGLSGEGALTWTPTNAQVGSHTFVVKLSDGKGHVAASFDVDISINHPPSFISEPVVDARVKEPYVYKLNISDTDLGDIIVVELVRFPTGMGYDPVTKELTWRPIKGQDGEHQIVIKATDGKHASYQNFTIYVKKEIVEEEDFLSANLPLIILALIVAMALIIAAVYIMRKRRGEIVIDDVFLIYKDGRLMTHHTRRLKPETDEHSISAMLTAIQDFVKESIPTEGEEQKPIDEIGFGDSSILLRHGKNVYIAAVVAGAEDETFKERMDESIDMIETRFKDQLSEWDGDLSEIDGVRRIMRGLLHGGMTEEGEEEGHFPDEEGEEEEKACEEE